jgi:hypothetical protein
MDSNTLGMHAFDHRVEARRAPRAREREVEQRTPVRAECAGLREARGDLPVEDVAASQEQSRIDARHAIEVARVHPVCVYDAQVRLRAEIATQPHEIIDGIVRRSRHGRFAVDRRQHADVEPSDFAAQLERALRRDDAPGVDEGVGHREVLVPLEEERPLFGERDRLSRIENHLADVGLHLREIRIHRGVEREIRRDTPRDVAAELRILPAIAPRGDGGARRRARGALRHHGIHVEHESSLQIGQPVDRSALREKRRRTALGCRPRLLVPRVLHATNDVHAPALRWRLLIADALEGDADLDFVAVFGEVPFRLELEIGTEIRAGGVPVHAVALHAEWIDGERVGAAAVVEGVQEELHVVVAGDPVPIGVRRVNGAVRLVRANAEIHLVVRVHHEDFGRVRRRHAVGGGELREAGQYGRGLPGRLVEPPVDLHRAGTSGQRQRSLAQTPVVHARRTH